MAVSVVVHLAGRYWNAEIDTRVFDSLPRMGEVVVFRLMRYWDRSNGLDITGAECEVTAVHHQVYADEKPDAHAYIEVTPRTDDDRAKLFQLYPQLTGEDDE